MAIVINPISPVAFSVMGLDVRWYALAYIAGFAAGYFIFKYLMRSCRAALHLDKKQLDDLLTWIVLGVIVGGRVGYVLFYNLPFFIVNPIEIFALWHGGMSFHGGLIGVILATALFCRRRRFDALRMLDMLAVATPIGFFFGRIANFINMEVMGRPTTVPWAVVFRGQTPIPRHPSPIYEASLEGLILFAILFYLYRFTSTSRRPGAVGGVMAMTYAVFRAFCELFRAPDAQIGFLTSWGLTMGQLLSGVMFLVGAVLFTRAMRRQPITDA